MAVGGSIMCLQNVLDVKVKQHYFCSLQLQALISFNPIKGGTMGLFTGASLLSAVEVIYWVVTLVHRRVFGGKKKFDQ